ncbi:hypothetical protein CCR75_007801 [Bremia lactucae]|uniref:Uncharacterized protein n=1 Tax=Bremia lactucae TaxID=4779 RepID=A0A976NZG6_BRELC|nr:hypothetical protein CCR75_007801 [Bremia lactucae]
MTCWKEHRGNLLLLVPEVVGQVGVYGQFNTVTHGHVLRLVVCLFGVKESQRFVASRTKPRLVVHIHITDDRVLTIQDVACEGMGQIEG